MFNSVIKLAACLGLTALTSLGLAAPALAQSFGVPSELLSKTRPVQGDGIRICIDDLSVGAPFDHDVSQAIADALFLEPTWNRGPGGFSLDGMGYFDELQIAMSNSCDMFSGISIQPSVAFPAWATVTRPYAQVPFVFVVTNPDYKNMNDIPARRKIGMAMGSIGQAQLLLYMTQRPEDQQWVTLPYADPNLMLKRLNDGTLDGIYIWQPVLMKITNGDPEAAGLHIVPTDPMPGGVVNMGALVTGRDAFLRSQIDDAIGALVADGTIARIMEEHGYAGNAGP